MLHLLAEACGMDIKYRRNGRKPHRPIIISSIIEIVGPCMTWHDDNKYFFFSCFFFFVFNFQEPKLWFHCHSSAEQTGNAVKRSIIGEMEIMLFIQELYVISIIPLLKLLTPFNDLDSCYVRLNWITRRHDLLVQIDWYKFMYQRMYKLIETKLIIN